jgi:hypothetical protein
MINKLEESDWTIEQWQNVVNKRGSIDPKTIIYAQERIDELKYKSKRNG